MTIREAEKMADHITRLPESEDAHQAKESIGSQKSDAPMQYHTERSHLPYHSAFAYYSSLKDRFGAEGLYLLESLSGPEADCRTAAVGFGPLLTLTIR